MLLWLSVGAFASKLPALAEGGPGGAERASSVWLLPPGEWLCKVVFVQKDSEDQVGSVPHHKGTDVVWVGVWGNRLGSITESLISCVTVSELRSLSEPQAPYLGCCEV